MADALRANYKIEKEIVVIYNGFSVKENKTILNKYHNSNLTLIWVSQTIGNGRGLETLIESLELLDIQVTLNLVGDCSFEYAAKLKAIFPFHKNHQLVIHPTVPHTELLFLLTQHNIGLALENNFPANKDKTISNKILQYIQAGIKILATNTHGQIEVAAYFPETVKIVAVNKPKEWAEKLKYLINSPKVNKQQQLEIFTKHFSWEAQEKKLARLVKNILQN
jgi:glycosyltransferase involved in cell wall biosynthesis